MIFCTPDLCDKFPEEVEVLGPDFYSFGGASAVCGEVVTIKLDKNNYDLAQMLQKEDGKQRIVVVDVDRKYYAVVGDNLMRFAFNNNWAGIIVNGYVRDTPETAKFPVGLFAVGRCPKKYIPQQSAIRDVEITIDDVKINSGDYIYADLDGVIISKKSLV